MQSDERRAPSATRIPFEGLVEVGGAMGPSFEAQAVNVSEEGMMLRTAYLPEPGQPLTCRFDAAGGQSVLAAGEVVWAEGAEKGGDFAIRFTDMDPESVDALRRLCGVTAQGEEVAPGPPAEAGSKVRLHIEGLASPMRAKVRASASGEVTVGSDLGFLQVGKQLELEDAQSGTKRAAEIDRVEVHVDPGSHVPQLVVRLRYADAQGQRPVVAASAPPPAGDDLRALEEASSQMKGAFARNAAKVGPAFEKLLNRAKTTVALLAARRAAASEAAAPRRTTSPAPGGGLHASGKRVVRGQAASEPDVPTSRRPTRKQMAIGGAVLVAAILGAVGLKKLHHEAPLADASTTPAPDSPAANGLTGLPPVAPAIPAPAPPPPSFDAPGLFPPSSSSDGPLATNDDPGDSDSKSHKKHGHATPFGNGPVHHGNVLHLKMDGPIEAIEGAQQPTGFAIKLPGRKSAEAAGPLASRDARIAAIKVSNDAAGAQLTVAFKDGVPNYQVSAKGDTLLIALAPAGEITANKSDGNHKHRKSLAKVH